MDTTPATLPDIEDCSKSSSFLHTGRKCHHLKKKKKNSGNSCSGANGLCPLCPRQPWDEELGAQNFPRKPAKKPPRLERTLTCVVTRRGERGEEEFLLMRRPNKGWNFVPMWIMILMMHFGWSAIANVFDPFHQFLFYQTVNSIQLVARNSSTLAVICLAPISL